MQASLEIKKHSVSNDNIFARLDVRAKLLITLFASLSTIIFSSIWSQLVLLVFSFIYVAFMNRIRIVLIAYAFLSLIALIAVICIVTINVYIPFMKEMSYTNLVIPFLRMATMMNVVLPLAFTGKIQNLLTALKGFKLPLFLYLPIAVMIRFLPTFIGDIKQIVESVKIRGVDVTIRNFMRHPIFMGRLVFMPLIIHSLRTAEDLGVAAELKGLGLNNKFTAYRTFKWKWLDTALSLMVLIVIGLAIVVEIYTSAETGGGHHS